MTKLDVPALRRLWPHAPAALVEAVAAQSADVFERFAINTPLRVAHFMAQVSHESGGGAVTAESLTYTHAARIAAVWPSRFTADSAAAYVNNPRALADKVYNGRMGNAAAGDDGWNYRGRGLLQITGRDSYRTMGKLCHVALEQHPDLAFEPADALEVAAAEFVHLGCLPYCDRDDVRIVTRRVNGGYIGLDSRKAWLTRWKLALPELPGELPEAPETLAAIAPVDAEPIARGGDNDVPPQAPGVMQSKTGHAQIGAGIATATSVAGAVLKASTDTAPALPDPTSISQLLDRAEGAKATADRIHALVPEPSMLKAFAAFIGDPVVAGALGLLALFLIGFTLVEHRKRLREGA